MLKTPYSHQIGRSFGVEDAGWRGQWKMRDEDVTFWRASLKFGAGKVVTGVTKDFELPDFECFDDRLMSHLTTSLFLLEVMLQWVRIHTVLSTWKSQRKKDGFFNPSEADFQKDLNFYANDSNRVVHSKHFGSVWLIFWLIFTCLAEEWSEWSEKWNKKWCEKWLLWIPQKAKITKMMQKCILHGPQQCWQVLGIFKLPLKQLSKIIFTGWSLKLVVSPHSLQTYSV